MEKEVYLTADQFLVQLYKEKDLENESLLHENKTLKEKNSVLTTELKFLKSQFEKHGRQDKDCLNFYIWRNSYPTEQERAEYERLAKYFPEPAKEEK